MAFRVTDVVVVPDRVLTREHVMLESDYSAGRPTSQMRIYAPICLFRERLTGTGGVERLFQRFDEVLRAVGYLVDSRFKCDTELKNEGLQRGLEGEAFAGRGVEGPEQGVEVVVAVA
jgi:hypothetical protein